MTDRKKCDPDAMRSLAFKHIAAMFAEVRQDDGCTVCAVRGAAVAIVTYVLASSKSINITREFIQEVMMEVMKHYADGELITEKNKLNKKTLH